MPGQPWFLRRKARLPTRASVVSPVAGRVTMKDNRTNEMVPWTGGRSMPRWQIWLWAVLMGFSAGGGAAWGQREVFLDPRSFGLELPLGPVRYPDGQTVMTRDEQGQAVTGLLHVQVGEGAIVLMPDGQLAARREGEWTPTDRRFEPLAKEALARQLAREFAGFKVKQTAHYVYVYESSEEFQFGTSQILESMLPGVQSWLRTRKLPVQAPAMPMVVVMFKDEATFRAYRRLPAEVVAYYDPVTHRIYLYEQSRLAQVRPELALRQAIATIAHEGAHQILHHVGIQQRLSAWPAWLSEGLAEYFAPTTVNQRLRWKGPGQPNDLRLFELEQYLKGPSASEQSGALVEHTVVAGQLTSTGYAAAWALVHYLAKQKPAELTALLDEARQIPPLKGAVAALPLGTVRENREMFTRLVGDDFASLETRLVAHVKRLPYNDPFADAPHFVATLVSLDAGRTKKQAATFPSLSMAAKWLQEKQDALPPQQRGGSQSAIAAFPNRAAAETFAAQWLSR